LRGQLESRSLLSQLVGCRTVRPAAGGTFGAPHFWSDFRDNAEYESRL